jgi:hypothetical protein
MKKELKDYLHLYLGCECRLDNKEKGKLIGFDSRLHDSEVEMVCFTIWMDKENDWTVYNDDANFDRIKPILRPLSDMTEDELKCLRSERGHLKGVHRDDLKFIIIMNKWSPEDFIFLLSKHFDLFGLIPAGLAIDKTTLK